MSKVGRPRGREYPIKEQVHVTEAMHEDIELRAKEKGITAPALIREAIQRHLNDLKEWSEVERKK